MERSLDNVNIKNCIRKEKLYHHNEIGGRGYYLHTTASAAEFSVAASGATKNLSY